MDRSRAPGAPALRTAPVRVVRVIARLNVGGPSIQAITVTKSLEPFGYRTTLIRGREGDHEANMDGLAHQCGVQPVLVSSLRRDPGWRDAVALFSLVRLMLRERPQVVHTHAAKAGTLGRLAALIAGRLRRDAPVIVHTFHGHSLTGYFSPRKASVYRRVERWLARHTSTLVAVSEEVRDELVALGVATSDRFEVIPLGFDLTRFACSTESRVVAREALRGELRIRPDAVVVTLIARLVPIKRVDRFLHAATLLQDLQNVHFLIVGDGELGEELRASSAALLLGTRVTWTGFRRDIPEVCFGSDVVVLCSDNEGTPVSLIEAAAAGLPTVCTRVGGASAVVMEGESGLLVARDDGDGLAQALRKLVGSGDLRASLGTTGRTNALRKYSLDRLLSDLDCLYTRLLDTAGKATPRAG